MQPWFMWNNVDSRTMDVWVTELPAPTRAAERIQEVEIPGMAGTLTLKEGDDVHEGYVRECVITVPSTADFASLLDWLRGDGQAVFSNEPNRVYTAHLAGEVSFSKISNSLKQAVLPFYVHPHKGQYPPENDITIDTSGTLYNPGNVSSRPILTLTLTTACTVVIGANTMTFTHTGSSAEETITVDCDAELVTNSNGLWEGKTTGEFFRVQPGDNTVTLTDCTATITPRWRWC